MYRLKNSSVIPRTDSVYLVFTFALALIVTWAGLAVLGMNATAQVPQSPGTAATIQPGSPSEAVREFYRLMRERKFREAFALSIYQPAIGGLKQTEFDDLRPDFERLASAIPEKVNISGEQISGEAATVFVKVKDDDNKEQAEPVALIRLNGKWIVGDKENHEIVKKAGSEFFFNARIDTHHNDVQDLLQRMDSDGHCRLLLKLLQHPPHGLGHLDPSSYIHPAVNPAYYMPVVPSR